MNRTEAFQKHSVGLIGRSKWAKYNDAGELVCSVWKYNISTADGITKALVACDEFETVQSGDLVRVVIQRGELHEDGNMRTTDAVPSPVWWRVEEVRGVQTAPHGKRFRDILLVRTVTSVDPF